MNLLEAVKTGRPMKRPRDKCWRGPFLAGDGYTEIRMELCDLTADDWEINDSPVSITRRQFWGAYAESVKETGSCYWTPDGDTMQLMAKKLGLI